MAWHFLSHLFFSHYNKECFFSPFITVIYNYPLCSADAQKFSFNEWKTPIRLVIVTVYYADAAVQNTTRYTNYVFFLFIDSKITISSEIYLRCTLWNLVQVFQMKRSFSSDNLRGFCEFASNSFLSAAAHVIALDLSWIRSRHEAMASSHFEPLLIWSPLLSSDSYSFFFFFFLTARVCSQTSGPSSICQPSGCFSL